MVRVHEQFVKICLKIRSNKNNYDARWRLSKNTKENVVTIHIFGKEFIF